MAGNIRWYKSRSNRRCFVGRVNVPGFQNIWKRVQRTSKSGPARHPIHLSAAPGVVSRLCTIQCRGTVYIRRLCESGGRYCGNSREHSASALPGRSSPARLKVRHCIAMLFACSAFQSWKPFAISGAAWKWLSNGLPSRCQCFYTGEESPLWPRFLSGILGLAYQEQCLEARL